jgi:16S rRNA (guanine527-N7)-methyltransferase
MSRNAFQLQLTRRASAAGIDLPTTLCEQLEAYYRLLAHWNETINLTALPLDPLTDEALDRLLIEPLAGARYVSGDAPSWFDLGTGGGSPAIPLKLAKPQAVLTMVESRYRKAAFLREASRSLSLSSTNVETERIENVAANSANAATADLVTVRAVRADEILFSAMRTLLKPGGRALLFGAQDSDIAVPSGFALFQDSADSESASRLLVLQRV